MTMPQYVTNVTSFKDSVRILKNKGILNEAIDREQWFEDFQDALRSAVDNNKNIIDKEAGYAKAMKALDHVNAINMYGMFQPGPGAVAFVSDIDDILAQAGDEEDSSEDDEFIDMIAKAEEEEAGKYTKNYDFPGGLGESMTDPDSEEFVLAVEDYLDSIEWGLTPEQEKEALIYLEDNAYDLQGDFANNYSVDGGANAAAKYIVKVIKGLNERSYKVSPNAISVSSLKKGDILGGSGLEVVSISAGAKTPSGKIEVTVKDPKTGNEVTKVWGKSTKVTVKKDLNEGKKKRKPKAELHPNQIHPQELRMGIKVELEHTDDLDKAKKIALDHLAENPFYYTALKLAGVESPSVPKYKAPVAFKKEVAAAVDLVDKINAMKPVKGVEKAKASSNKAKKETNSGVKGVEELTHNAQTVRGLQKFAATGGKMKTIRENQLNEGGEYMFSGTLTGQETADLKKMIPGVEIEEEELDDTYKTVISHPTYNEKTLRHAIKQVMGQLSSTGNKKDLGASFDKLKSSLEEIVREVLAEMYDGRDDMNAQYAEDEIK